MRYLLLLIVIAFASCANPEPDTESLTQTFYRHDSPRQLGKIHNVKTTQSGEGWVSKWYFFDNYLLNLDYEADTLESIHIDHRVGYMIAFELTDCCFDVIRERPDTCWWWSQLPNTIRDEIASRKYKQ